MINTPMSKANETAAASVPKRPWAKHTIRTLRIVSTRSGMATGRDEDMLPLDFQPSYAPVS